MGRRWFALSALVGSLLAVGGVAAALPPKAQDVEITEATPGAEVSWKPAVADPDSNRRPPSVKGSAPSPFSGLGLFPDLEDLPPEASARAQAAIRRARRRLVDSTVYGLAFTVLLFAGMNTIYIEPATLGSIGDYAGALAWGFGTQTAMTGLTALFGKAGPIELPTTAAAI